MLEEIIGRVCENYREDIQDLFNKEEKIPQLDYEEKIKKPLELTLETVLEDAIKGINKDKNDVLDKEEERICSLNEEIKEYILSKKLNEKYNIEIQLRELEPQLAREEFQIDFNFIFGKKAIIGKIGVEKEEIVEVVEPSTFIEYLLSIFFGEKKNINEEKLDEQLEELKLEFVERFVTELEHYNKNANAKLAKLFEEFSKKLSSEFKEVVNSYQKTNEEFIKAINMDEAKIEEMIQFFEYIKETFEKIENEWNEIKS
jgi:hypothetical protein